jgi:molecular chaperone GrpE
MSQKDKKKIVDISPDEDVVEPGEETAEQVLDASLEDGVESGEREPESELDAKVREYDDLKDRHLRMVAEFDNFRKRTAKQMAASGTAAQALLITRLLDPLDDLGRVADLDAEKTAASDVLAGIELVEKKILKELEVIGLEKVGIVGEPFDPNNHEAVGTVPVAEDASADTVATVLQMGYKIGTVLLRPAMVQVYM